MRILPIIFKQSDPRWADIKLGNSPSVTLGQSSCYVCSFAMIANYYGKKVTPDQLNQILIDKKLYVNEDEIGGDDTLQLVYPDIKFEKEYLFPDDPPTPADLNLLKTLMSDPT